MSKATKQESTAPVLGWFLVLLGISIIAFGWLLPSRFKSIPFEVALEAGESGSSLVDLAETRFLDGNVGSARLLAEGAKELGQGKSHLLLTQVEMQTESNPQLERWGAWDPFLDAALGKVPLDAYSDQPGMVGILLSQTCREQVGALLDGSRNPLVQSILGTGDLRAYKRLFPVSSQAGRPLEVTLLTMSLLAQGDHFQDSFRSELRELIGEAQANGVVGDLEDVYLDQLSLARLFDWGQLDVLMEKVDSAETLRRLRYLFHRQHEQLPLAYAMAVSANDLSRFLDYLAEYGDAGFETLKVALGYGLDGFNLILRERLPMELRQREGELSRWERLQAQFAPYALRNPGLALSLKYAAFFLGSFLALYGGSRFGRFYKERVSPALAYTQRVFGSLAAVIVFGVLSEPYLAKAGEFEGYSFRFVMPVLAQVDGQLQVVETTPSTLNMEPTTLISIAFFFLLQSLVFLICMLKVREIDKREADSLVKLKLMENEENLFDSGLYVGIAGTCISLVMQVIGLVEANLLAAYSSNLFGILCVAIVKIRLVRPYKTRLILASEEKIAQLKRGEG